MLAGNDDRLLDALAAGIWNALVTKTVSGTARQLYATSGLNARLSTDAAREERLTRTE
jgi:hypothetical protein